jgi:hypothetical protein
MVFALLWALVYGVGAGILREGEVSAFKFADPRYLLLVAPILLGGLFYLMMAAFAAECYLGMAISRCYHHLLPKTYGFGLQQLLLSPMLLNTERIIGHIADGKWKRINMLWMGLLLCLLLVGTLAGVGHSTYLLWNAPIATMVTKFGSITTGLVLWLRGMLLLLVSVESSGLVDD